VKRACGRIVLATLGALLSGPLAQASPADECIGAAEQAQPLKHDGKLRAAREELRVCTRPQCPSLIRSDCTRWLAEIDATAPSIVVHATDPSGSDLVDVRVLIDGQLAAASLDGRDIAIDPGPHVLRFEHAGSAPIEERLVAVLGEQHRRLAVAFQAADERRDSRSRSGPLSSSVRDPETASPDVPHGRAWILPAALGGTGLVAIGAGTLLWSHGLSQCRSNIDRSAPSCGADQSNAAHATLIAGDVVAGAGVAAAALALVLWWMRAGDDARRPAASVRGSVLEIVGSF
jgi:hypothetical protein